MHHIAYSAVIDVPVDVCFAYVDDYRTVTKWAFGVTEFVPIGERERGLGTLVRMTAKLGPLILRGEGRVSEYDKDRLIAVALTKGPVAGIATWVFEPTQSGGTCISADMAYAVSSGLAGRTLSKIIDSIVTPGIAYTETRLRRQISAAVNDVN